MGSANQQPPPQFEQQKTSQQQKQFEPTFFGTEIIWHTVCKDDNSKPLLLFLTDSGET